MPHFMLYCIDHPNKLDLRKATREAHLAYVRGSGKLEFGGPLADDDGKMIGSLVVIEAASREDAENFVANDPYSQAGLFQTTTITRFMKP